MSEHDLLFRLAVALAIGLLIGIERGWKARSEAEGERTVGLRTLTLTGLLGGALAALGQASGEAGLVTALGFLAYAPMIAFFRYREMANDRTFGATTIVAAYLVYALGALAVLGDPSVAAAAGVATAGLLALKSALHGWLRAVTWEELRAGLMLLAMTLILLPILPDRAMGPFDAINPYELWLMTILIAAVSSVGYIAMKWGSAERGLAISGIAGGLVSSTAVTLSFSRLARENPGRQNALVSGMLLAGMTMMLRILFVAGAISPSLLRWLLAPLLLAALATAGYAGGLMRRAEGESATAPIALKNPFELATVLKFGAFLALIMIAAKAATSLAGSWGAFGLAAVSGIADVDAITLTMARSSGVTLSAAAAAAAILIAAAANSAAKSALSWSAGGSGPGRHMAIASGLALIAGAFGFAISWIWDPLAAI